MDFRGVLSPTGAEPSPGKKIKCKPPLPGQTPDYSPDLYKTSL